MEKEKSRLQPSKGECPEPPSPPSRHEKWKLDLYDHRAPTFLRSHEKSLKKL